MIPNPKRYPYLPTNPQEVTGKTVKEKINHPAHYQHPSGIEVIEIVRHENFNRGNSIKYILRAGKKDPETEVEDLEKAIFYLKDEIKRLEKKAEIISES